MIPSTIEHGIRQPQVDFVHSELDRLSHLAKNWDGYGAPPIKREIIDAARRFVDALPASLVFRP